MKDPITAFGLFVLTLFRRPAATAPAADSDEGDAFATLRRELERQIARDEGRPKGKRKGVVA